MGRGQSTIAKTTSVASHRSSRSISKLDAVGNADTIIVSLSGVVRRYDEYETSPTKIPHQELENCLQLLNAAVVAAKRLVIMSETPQQSSQAHALIDLLEPALYRAKLNKSNNWLLGLAGLGTDKELLEQANIDARDLASSLRTTQQSQRLE